MLSAHDKQWLLLWTSFRHYCNPQFRELRVSVSPLLHQCRLTNVSRPLSITGRSRCIIMSFSIAVSQRQRVVHEKLCLLGQVAFTGIVGWNSIVLCGMAAAVVRFAVVLSHEMWDNCARHLSCRLPAVGGVFCWYFVSHVAYYQC